MNINKIAITLLSVFMLTNLLKLLHPFIPFFTESVWSQNKYNNFFNTSLVNASWPNFKNKLNLLPLYCYNSARA